MGGPLARHDMKMNALFVRQRHKHQFAQKRLVRRMEVHHRYCLSCYPCVSARGISYRGRESVCRMCTSTDSDLPPLFLKNRKGLCEDPTLDCLTPNACVCLPVPHILLCTDMRLCLPYCCIKFLTYTVQLTYACLTCITITPVYVYTHVYAST